MLWLATAPAKAEFGFTWSLLVIAIMIIGVIGFLIYRWLDIAQYRFIPTVSQPPDLSQLTPETYQDKQQRKRTRTLQHFFKTSGSWGIQALYIIPGMILIVNWLHKYGFADGTVYGILMVMTFVMNMLLSRLFSLWSPTRPFTTWDYPDRRTWIPGNMAWQAWGVVSWAVPTYFFFAVFGVQGWIGSVAFIALSQIIQLIVFIHNIKKRCVPYLQYEGFSADFKASLQSYLAAQGMKDHEVGVIKDMNVGPNAFATSLTRFYRQVVITEELIKGYPDPTNPRFILKLKEDTIESVIAHEVGHINHHHVEKSISLGIAISALATVAVYYLFGRVDPAEFYFHGKISNQLMLYWGQSLFNVMLVYPLTFFMIGFIRKNEWEADQYMLTTNGCKRGYDFFYQIRHIAPIPNHEIWDRCNSTHPSPHLREEKMRQWEKDHCR
jgi:Zn-dependent protease with chaperone function